MNQKKQKIIGGIVAVVAVVTLISITYAGFTQQLTINGTASAIASSWKIKFTNLQAADLVGEAEEVTAPEIKGDTSIGDFSIKLKKPGDSVSYTFDVINEGTFDAEVSSKTVPKPECNGTGQNAEQDAANVCKNLTYTLKYSEGGEINNNDDLNKNNGTKTLKLTLTYNAETPAEELPKDDVEITNLQAAIVYSQK